MANERDFELLDDYLTNRLSEQDRSAFEQQLKADPDLQHEFALQKRLIQGIKDARVAQLKSMLNQVPVPSATTGNAIATKILLGTLVTLVIATAAFLYYRDKPTQTEATSTQQEETKSAPAETPVIVPEAKVETETPQSPVVAEKSVQEADKNQTSAGTEHSRPSLSRKPDPLTAPAPKDAGAPESTDASISVDNSNAAYSFHYRFDNANLMLFGPFEEGTFQVITVAEAGKVLKSLYYKGTYYLLQDTNNEIRSLSQVTDASLAKKFERKRLSAE